jgi:predicted TIM-barrel fold metal-dependent hydrolase
MRVDDMILISVDDHVVEPPDLFDEHLPAKWRDVAPRIERTSTGRDAWVYEGARIYNIGMNAVAGKPRHRYGLEPTCFEDMRPGCYDVHARVKDMNANGVLSSLCFPSFPQFCGQLFARSNDKDAALALVRAYNDWHVDGWCGAYPDRFIPLAIPPLWDPELMGDEVRRLARKGCHAVTFSENPAKLGHPSWHSPHWDPFLRACDEEGTVVCLHIGSSSEMVLTAMDAPVPVQISLQGVNIMQAAADLVFSRVSREFPNITVALSEGGIGWVPYYLERADYTYRRHGEWTGVSLGDRLPSEIFREHVLTCFISDSVGLELRHHIGVENIAWECDYPHSDSTWPDSPEDLGRELAGIPDDEVELITHANAMRTFRFDPFTLRPRERATVGALREEAVGWDVAIRDVGEPWVAPTEPLTQEQKLAAFARLREDAEAIG